MSQKELDADQNSSSVLLLCLNFRTKTGVEGWCQPPFFIFEFSASLEAPAPRVFSCSWKFSQARPRPWLAWLLSRTACALTARAPRRSSLCGSRCWPPRDYDDIGEKISNPTLFYNFTTAVGRSSQARALPINLVNILGVLPWGCT